MFLFGAGTMFATPLTDASGTAIAATSQTPIIIGTLQNVDLDISGEVKELFGQNQFAAAVGRGKVKVTGKAKFASIFALQFNNVFFGQTLAAGLVGIVQDTVGAAIPGTPYAITPTVPSSGTWQSDLGVMDANGRPMTRVSGTPTTGQYAVAAGVYTFASADTTKVVYISYRYTATVSPAQKQTIANQPMGYAPTFRVDLAAQYNGKSMSVRLVSCIGTKLSLGMKNDDFTIPDFEFSAFADAAGNVMELSYSE